MIIGISENWPYNERRDHLRPNFSANPVSGINMGVKYSTLATWFSGMAPVEVAGARVFKLMITAVHCETSMSQVSLFSRTPVPIFCPALE
jgi:hypothetical protein